MVAKYTANPRYFKLAEHAFTRRFVVADPGSSPDDYLKPDAWVHVARHVGVNDEIVIVPDTAEWRLEVWVQAKPSMETATYLKVREIRRWVSDDFKPVAADQPSRFSQPAAVPGYKIKFDPRNRYKVIDETTGTVVSRGHMTSAEAEKALAAFVAEMNGAAPVPVPA